MNFEHLSSRLADGGCLTDDELMFLFEKYNAIVVATNDTGDLFKLANNEAKKRQEQIHQYLSALEKIKSNNMFLNNFVSIPIRKNNT